MRLIVRKLNILRSAINAISTSFEIKEIVEAAGINLPHLFDFVSFGVLWGDGRTIYLYEEASTPPGFRKRSSATWSGSSRFSWRNPSARIR